MVSSQVPVIQIIVNPSVIKQNLNERQVRRIFSMRQTAWSDQQAIHVYVLANKHIVHQHFSTQILGLFPYQLERIWNNLVFSGLGEAPITVNNEQEMLDKISKHPGAIGYVTSAVMLPNVRAIELLKE